MEIPKKGRRKFLAHMGLGIAALGLGNARSYAFLPKNHIPKSEMLNIGFITDLHHGYCKDAMERLDVFIKEASSRQLDFIIQGGDFCHPTPEARVCIDLWNSYKGEKYHVLGNHDMDKGSKQDAIDFLGMDNNYYSFDKGDFHFVVMDGNYILNDGKYEDYGHANFYIDQQHRSLVNPEQIEWLKQDLERTDKQTLIFSHQAFDEIWNGWSSPSRFAVRKVIDDANNRTDYQKVIACFCGHHHVDDHSYINNVHYFQMNSASYYYVGDGFGSDGSRAMYKDPIFAFLSLDPSGHILIEGRQSQFMHPTPTEKRHPDAPRLSASISDRKVGFKRRG
ncbi:MULTISPECIES: metallophosphoesterase [unclassified Arenibacter]|jgi:3',5'-cyclic AMP phosphodiesterase CpdA|uniref:metallophosphoesterase family protein n=1 Tax=unclassified Arenibacter TaxID=2615047 RepID=UPI000E3458FB|nr:MULTISPECIES: metallophosphoesterase [unclassified Arenibacter]MCM4162541.1 metallophosphoesterase [Arenibacter sp. A80]RFT58122.1 metallophosphoesterase [Arenibacter sp. P308M17]